MQAEPFLYQQRDENAFLIGYSRHQPGSTAKSCSSHGDPPPYSYSVHIVSATLDSAGIAVGKYDTSHEFEVTITVID